MKILAFKTNEFTGKVGEYELQINPEDYSMSNEGAPQEPERTANGDVISPVMPPEDPDLTIKFYLDSTGIIEGCTDVGKSIKSFKDLCLEMNGEIHQPNFLKVLWGSNLAYTCKLKSMKVDYLMFKSNGSPIRAKLEATFTHFTDPASKAKRQKKRSPDLTHLRQVTAGDSLPAMCKEIYGDTRYYIQIARINNLVNFRKLVPGDKLVFPKLEK